MSALAINRKASFDYEILETYEAGIKLIGSEVKSVKTGHISLAGSFVVIRNGEAWLINAAIPPYQPKNVFSSYDPERTRKLLLHRRELEELIGKTSQKGLTLVPLRVYTKGPRIKMEFALVRRKKKYDKRDKIREREDKRKIERAMKVSL